MLQPSGYMKVCSYDNVKPSRTDATAIRKWGVWCGVVGREAGGGKGEWREGEWREGGVEGREWKEGGWRKGGVEIRGWGGACKWHLGL